MGGLDVIVCTELKHLYCKLGGAIYCADTTTGATKKYHKKKAKKWLALITEIHPIIFGDTFTTKQFRNLLYKHFTSEILQELPYILKLDMLDEAYNKKRFEKQLKAGLKKWLLGDY